MQQPDVAWYNLVIVVTFFFQTVTSCCHLKAQTGKIAAIKNVIPRRMLCQLTNTINCFGLVRASLINHCDRLYAMNPFLQY